MTGYEQVHWHEGLFLQPHHLQAMERRWQGALAAERRLRWCHPYGLIQVQVSQDAMENMLLAFDRLHAVMPSGLEVRVPENADLPVLSIKEAFAAATDPLAVRLAVPLWRADGANTLTDSSADGGRAKRIWRVGEVERPDENTGENPQPMQVRRINARLLLEGEDTSDLEVLPLLRIAHATGEGVGKPRQDATWAPPCLVLGGSPVLGRIVLDLANQVAASRRELAAQLARDGSFSIQDLRGGQFEMLLRLRTLGRYAGTLPALARSPALSPFEAYLQLRALLGELAALHPEQDPFAVPDYDHDDPKPAFDELAARIRGLLRSAVRCGYLKVELQPADGVLAAALETRHVEGPNEYFLAVRTRQDPRALMQLVEDADRFKLMARSIVLKRIYGVRLEREPIPPPGFPADRFLHYFRLNRHESHRMWARIEQERALAARWPDMESCDFSLALYMTVPAEEA